MAWFGESLSSITGHLQNFTKEVLSEANEETKGAGADQNATKEKLEELEAICSTQDLEICALKKQNAELRRRLHECGALEEEEPVAAAVAATPSWLSVEQRCDAGYSSRRHTAHPEVPANAARHHERLEKELKERIQLIEHLQIQLRNVELERHVLSQKNSDLEKEIEDLSKQMRVEITPSENESKLVQENQELRSQLQEATKKMAVLEEELLGMRNQCLDHVIDSQVNASEIRLDVEQTRRKLSNEMGIRAEKLRAHQDLVNRMIQMGEKTRESEKNVIRLQAEDQKLAAEMATKIEKLGDKEHQEYIHGTIHALELENQVLNMRNAQLEKESKIGMKLDEHKLSREGADPILRSECYKLEDDADGVSFPIEHTDQSELILHLQSEISKLQKQVEEQKDVILKKYELEENVKYLKEQLQEKAMSNLSESQITKTEVNKEELSKHAEEKVTALGIEIKSLKDELKTLQEDKQCLTQELEAMARVVQDLEAQVAAGVEERSALETSIEELDQQHQDAIDQLILLRNAELAENESLKSEIKELKLSALKKTQSAENSVQTDVPNSCQGEISTQTEGIHQNDQENQTSSLSCDKEVLTDTSECEENMKCSKFDKELCELIKNMVNFEVPGLADKKDPQTLEVVRGIINFASDCKWKKETLERKLAASMREKNECLTTITVLELECSRLKEDVEQLSKQLVGIPNGGGDALPTIPENSEEFEVLEQKNALLEEEISVLRETRQNLEQDAYRVRGDQEELLCRLRNMEAEVRNYENLLTEMRRSNEETNKVLEEVQSSAVTAEMAKVSAEEEATFLKHELEICVESYEKQIQEMKESTEALIENNESLVNQAAERDQKLEEMQDKVSDLLNEKCVLIEQLQKMTDHSEVSTFEEEKRIMEKRIEDLQKQLEETEYIKFKMQEISNSLQSSEREKIDLLEQLDVMTKNLLQAQSIIEESKVGDKETEKLQKTVASLEIQCRDALQSISELDSENQILRGKLKEQELTFQNLNLEKVNHAKEVEDLKGQLEKELISSNERKKSFEDLFAKNVFLQKEKDCLEDTLLSVSQQKDLLLEERDTLKAELSALTKAIDQLKLDHLALQNNVQQLEEMKATMEELSSNLKKLEDENQQLKAELSEKEISYANRMQQMASSNLTESPLLAVMESKLEKQSVWNDSIDVKKAVVDSTGRLLNEEEIELVSSKLNEEKHDLTAMSDESKQQVVVLESKVKEFQLLADQYKEKMTELENLNSSLLEEKSQFEEKLVMTKKSVTNLSEIIKDKDIELVDLKAQVSRLQPLVQKVEDVNQQLLQTLEVQAQLVQERDQLLQTVHLKHQESVQYHAEIQRLSALLSEELAKNQKLAGQYNSLAEQYNEEASNGSPKHQQDLKDMQDLIRTKDEGLQKLCNRLEMKEQELQTRAMEMEALQQRIEVLTLERVQHPKGAGTAAASPEIEELQQKYNDVVSECQEEQRKYKNLQNELDMCQGRECSLQKELERLRAHLVEIEDMYTQEALRSEEHIKELTSKLQQAEEMVMSSSTVYKSANIRANQQVETMQEQARLIAQQRDDVQVKLSAAEDQIAKHAAALCNLQAVLEQFQRDKEREIQAAKAEVYLEVEAAQMQQQELRLEISSLKSQLSDAKEGLSAASRLGEELERKTEAVNRLKQEATLLQEKAQKAQQEVEAASRSTEGKVDKSLVKNVVLGFFLAPTNSKAQVLQVVSSILSFSEEERKRVLHSLGLPGPEGGGGGWFKSLLHPGGEGQERNNQSLAEAFVRFLENESKPQPRLKMLPDKERAASTTDESPGTRTPVQRNSPLLLADMQLPTFAQFPVGRNSSSILKDILKES